MRTRITAAAVGLAAAAVLSACGGTGGDGGSAASTSTGGSSSSSAAGAAAAASSGSGSSTVQVEAKDYTLSLATTSFTPGRYTFEMKNDGHATHAIEIDGPGVEDQKSGTAGPGGTSSVTVTLQSGKYDIYCPVGNHRAMGMETSLTVG